jgi:hypothetical protein
VVAGVSGEEEVLEKEVVGRDAVQPEEAADGERPEEAPQPPA